ncbi:VOC family protein [Nocardioides jishulii]|uniref:VOC family protein n=1 Tax=Nocardioides jishulii TaxID=2575440 RepID=A0A4U2YQK7_9ACTN|nr:VOC family protein [Nocardioides jishulii]QCX26565.1 VOC family protein [Nocardioides jishulii]TKI63628.1 VOC family protein [Nocardioides jishulii]
MTSYVSHTSFDCANAYALSQWWQQMLGYVDDREDPSAPGDEECSIHDPETGHTLWFLEVPESKQVKNRLHLDLRPRERTQDAEVEWALGIGATQVADLRGEYGPGTGWVVLADPEGNEFCILRSEHEVREVEGE